MKDIPNKTGNKKNGKSALAGQRKLEKNKKTYRHLNERGNKGNGHQTNTESREENKGLNGYGKIRTGEKVPQMAVVKGLGWTKICLCQKFYFSLLLGI
jgi:hypothetical protein